QQAGKPNSKAPSKTEVKASPVPPKSTLAPKAVAIAPTPQVKKVEEPIPRPGTTIPKARKPKPPNDSISVAKTQRMIEQRETERLEKKLRFFLTHYATYYASGDYNGLAELYSDNAVQQNLIGRNSIRNYYQRFFRLTDSREVSYVISDVKKHRDDILINARYNAQFNYRGGKTENLTGVAHFVVR
ncbi:MAG: hypothetical protein GY706_03445, partial [Bacteroides sp.]|nr:hypothetical protein [Bacteroides sp.]